MSTTHSKAFCLALDLLKQTKAIHDRAVLGKSEMHDEYAIMAIRQKCAACMTEMDEGEIVAFALDALRMFDLPLPKKDGQ